MVRWAMNFDVFTARLTSLAANSPALNIGSPPVALRSAMACLSAAFLASQNCTINAACRAWERQRTLLAEPISSISSAARSAPGGVDFPIPKNLQQGSDSH